MSSTLSGDGFKQGLLILEPRGEGDARAQATDLLLVEQYKTEPRGTWSLSDVTTVLRGPCESVPDLVPSVCAIDARLRSYVDNLGDEAGIKLEGMVVELACRRLRGNGDIKDLILEAVRRILVLFAGAGVSDLMERMIDNEF